MSASLRETRPDIPGAIRGNGAYTHKPRYQCVPRIVNDGSHATRVSTAQRKVGDEHQNCTSTPALPCAPADQGSENGARL